jgi:hypothetical protein
MKGMLGEEKPPAPESLVVAYPELEAQVSVERSRLF